MKKCFRLKNFPITFFAPILGLSGFALALTKAENLFGFPKWVANSTLNFTLVLFVIILAIYFFKFIFFTNEVIKEYQHPVKINFFPLVPKIILVLSVVFLEINMTVSLYLWITGVIVNTLTSFSILGEWISKEHFKIEHMSPAWFIPVVGYLIIPIAGVKHFPAEISWFFFSVGITWMFMLTTIIINRLIFHTPMAKKLAPTLFILFAAPAIAFIAYYKLTGELDPFAHILFYFSSFLFLLIASQWKLFTKIKFYLSWWAYTFPLAAYALANGLMFNITKIVLFKYITGGVLGILTLFILGLIWMTIKAIQKQELCVEE